jgi:hypothetical protein
VVSVVRLGEQHIEPAAETLAGSFFDDPLRVYMIPDGRERARTLPSDFAPFVRYGYLFGEVHTTRSLRWIVTLHHDRDLTILNVRWTPGMAAYPHDHRMWALIGVYGGREDNTFHRPSPERLQVAGGTQLETGNTALL